MSKEELTSVTPDSVTCPEKWYSFAILLDGVNLFHCNEKDNALFHLKDLAENKYLPKFRKEFPDREVYINPGDLKTKFTIVRKTEGKLRWGEPIVTCCTLELVRVPCIRRVNRSTTESV